MASVYEQLGGSGGVDAAVDIFYRKMLTDDRVSHFFEGIDMEAQAAKQKGFLTMVLGGPHNYSGRSMREAHARLAGLSDAHVDIVIGHLGDTLRELGVPDALIAEVAAVADSVRGDVLNR
jgi:hemoglobin